jgi:hypothetical protein
MVMLDAAMVLLTLGLFGGLIALGHYLDRL